LASATPQIYPLSLHDALPIFEAMALCKNPEMRLLIAGRGDARPYKTTRLRFWREDPVQFLGEVADLAPLYAAADILILPTIYDRSEEHTSELQSRGHLVCRLL